MCSESRAISGNTLRRRVNSYRRSEGCPPNSSSACPAFGVTPLIPGSSLQRLSRRGHRRPQRDRFRRVCSGRLFDPTRTAQKARSTPRYARESWIPRCHRLSTCCRFKRQTSAGP
jgi:hypothetical protein